jgi:SNF2 family DNA or RNA helicase
MLFMQTSYSEVQNMQARDRVHRIGSERHDAIRIIEQITPGTIEERRRELLATKQIRMEEVVRDRATLAKLLGAAA